MLQKQMNYKNRSPAEGEKVKSATHKQDSFSARVYRLVALIPRGKVLSYGRIARMLGAPGAARQVGWAMRHCPDDLPWHRVVKADGTIAKGGFPPLRRAMLEAEGIRFTEEGVLDTGRHLWEGK